MSDKVTELNLPNSIVLPLSEIQPYENNPRRITQEAIDGAANSIQEYGYVQPIVVDKDHVVIVGHTRLLALEQLGWDEAEVLVADLPADKVSEYRLVDNKTGELSGWDYDSLVIELRESQQSVLDRYFPDVDLEVGMLTDAMPKIDMEAATNKVTAVTGPNAENMHTTSIECPACYNDFEVRTRTLPGVTYEDLAKLAEADGEPE